MRESSAPYDRGDTSLQQWQALQSLSMYAEVMSIEVLLSVRVVVVAWGENGKRRKQTPPTGAEGNSGVSKHVLLFKTMVEINASTAVVFHLYITKEFGLTLM